MDGWLMMDSFLPVPIIVCYLTSFDFFLFLCETFLRGYVERLFNFTLASSPSVNA